MTDRMWNDWLVIFIGDSNLKGFVLIDRPIVITT
jgi:hypothetical protein